jgi:hypothetical protein
MAVIAILGAVLLTLIIVPMGKDNPRKQPMI